MNGFRVDTNALAEAGDLLCNITKQISECRNRADKAVKSLSDQTLSDQISSELSSTINLLSVIEQETRELTQQCKEISNTYNDTEDAVARMVATLLSESILTDSTDNSGSVLLRTGFNITVNTRYVLGESALFFSHQLPCENWLRDRVIHNFIREK